MESGQKAQSFNLPKNSQKFNRKVLATNLSETASSPMTNGGFNEATWGKLDVNNWHGSVQDGVYELTGYTGDEIHIIIPNEADFEKAGQSTNGLQVGINRDTVQSLLTNYGSNYTPKTIAFSKTNDQKVKAIGTDWSHAFSRSAITNFDGSNLDVSGVTNMSSMFGDMSLINEISNLSSLANWDTSKVTDMSNMFRNNKISDLTPLANWDTSNVTNMGDIFSANPISDLTPLANWNTGNVTNMGGMFSVNSISDLTPLANWDVSNVTNMRGMFNGNKISDLTGLAKWNTSNVTNMGVMFWRNKVSDLTPLANWNVSNVRNMSEMFEDNQISDLTPLAHWNTSGVIGMIRMFYNNKISDLTGLANWNTGKVAVMMGMFSNNSISDLTPLTHWDTSNVTNMSSMFAGNSDLIDLRPIANWNISSITNNFNGHSGLAGLFSGDTKLDLTNINNAPLMQGFLKTPVALIGATFITNNVDLVKATTGKDLPVVTNTAKRTIVFNFPDGTSKTITQHIYYKTIAPVQIEWPAPTGGGNVFMILPAVSNPVQSAGPRIIKTYTIKDVKASDWALDDSQHNDAIIVNGQIRFASVKIPHINGYKAHFVPNKPNPALFTVSFIAVPTENKPSTPAEETPSKQSVSTAPTENKPTTPVEETPSKPSAPTDNSSNSAWSDLDHKVVNALNQSDSGWTLPADNSTYKVEVPVNDVAIDLSDLVIAQPVHAQTRTQIRVNKRFKLRKHGKKHAVKHFKQRKKTARTFKKYRL